MDIQSDIQSNQLYFSPKVCFKVDDWTVVDPDDSVIPVRTSGGGMMVSEEREKEGEDLAISVGCGC